MSHNKRDYGADPNVTKSIVGFRAPGDPSPQDTVLGATGMSPELSMDIVPPPYHYLPKRPSNLNAAFSNAGNISNLSSLSGLAGVSAGPAAKPLMSTTSLPQPSAAVAVPLAEAAPPATLSAPNSPPTGSPTSTLKHSAAASVASSTTSTAPSTAAPSVATTSTSSTPSTADLAAMSKAERKAYYDALNQTRVKEPPAKLSKEERRAKQEAERAEKASKTGKGPPSSSSASSTSSARPAPPSKPAPSPAASAAPAAGPTSTSAAAPAPADLDAIELISNLKASIDLSSPTVLKALMAAPGYHDAILHLGWRYQNYDIMGGTARTRTMLNALKEVVKDYRCPAGKEPARDIAAHISIQVGFLAAVRKPLGLHMGNAVRHLKSQIGKLAPVLTEAQVKTAVVALIDRFMEERIRLPLRQIIERAAERIEPGDHIVTFCRSEVVLKALIYAHKVMSADPNIAKPPFTVGVADNSETQEGKAMLALLKENGVDAVYEGSVFIASLSAATKVFLGAAAVLSCGSVYTRAGADVLATLAKEQATPVIVLSETFKFHERSEVSATSHNELGDWKRGALDVPEYAPRGYKAGEEEAAGGLKGFTLRYCLIPHDYVNMIICEAAAVPPAGAVAQMRRHRKDTDMKQ